MASDRETLEVDERTDFGSRTARRLRREGLVPGVVYGSGSEARAFQVSERVARVAIERGGALIDLKFGDGKAVPVVIKERQQHPVRDQIVHLDFLEVSLDQAITSDVSIELIGAEDAPGVKNDGGVLEHVTREVTVEALPTDIPESIPVDVSGMEIGDTLQLSSVTAPDGVTFSLGEDIDAEEVTIATLSPPRVEEEEPEVEEEAELIGEDGEPTEGEGDEGEAGADGGDDESADE